MGAFGSVLGGIMTVFGLFLAGWATWVYTGNFLIFLLFPLFGIIGGVALGSLNSRKARTQEKYKNEYISIAAMAFAAMAMLAIYYLFIGTSSVETRLEGELGANVTVILAFISGILTQLGLGLVIANSLAENTGY